MVFHARFNSLYLHRDYYTGSPVYTRDITLFKYFSIEINDLLDVYCIMKLLTFLSLFIQSCDSIILLHVLDPNIC